MSDQSEPTPRAPVPPRARGLAFTGLLKIASEKFGREAVELSTRDAPEVRAIIGTRISGLRGYPYPAFAEFLAALRVGLGGGDPLFCRWLGAEAARRDLATVFTTYTVKPSPERLIQACSGVWSSYYENAGTMEAVSWLPERTIVRIVGFRAMSPDHCRLMEGWMVSAMEVIGIEVHPGSGETVCTSKGGSFHEFACQWTAGAASEKPESGFGSRGEARAPYRSA